MIFTFVWAFNQKEDWKMVDDIAGIFESNGGEVYFVELEAELEERLRRNKTPNRLEQKPSKRNVEQSEKRLLSSLDELRLSSEDGEIERKHYLKIDNTHLEADEVAEAIRTEFQLT